MPASSAPVEVELEEKAVPVRFTKTFWQLSLVVCSLMLGRLMCLPDACAGSFGVQLACESVVGSVKCMSYEPVYCYTGPHP